MNYFIGYYNRKNNFVVRQVIEDFQNVSREHVVIHQTVGNDQDISIFSDDESFRFKKILKDNEIGIFTNKSIDNGQIRVKLSMVLKFNKHKNVLSYLKSEDGREQIKNIIIDMELNDE